MEDNQASPKLQAMLKRIQDRIAWAEGQPWFNSNEPDWAEDMRPVFPGLAKWFPATQHGTKEERDEIRHCILMALTGRAISSQYELSVGIHILLKKEFLRDNSTYLTRELADELTAAVQGPFSLTPWAICTGAAVITPT